MKKLNLLLLLLTTSLLGCRDTQDLPDPKAPQVQLLAPKAGEKLAGDSLPLSAEIRHEVVLHSYRVLLRRPGSDFPAWEWSRHTHQAELKLDTVFALPDTLRPGAYQLQVEAVDHDQFSGTENRKIRVE